MCVCVCVRVFFRGVFCTIFVHLALYVKRHFVCVKLYIKIMNIIQTQTIDSVDYGT